MYSPTVSLIYFFIQQLCFPLGCWNSGRAQRTIILSIFLILWKKRLRSENLSHVICPGSHKDSLAKPSMEVRFLDTKKCFIIIISLQYIINAFLWEIGAYTYHTSILFTSLLTFLSFSSHPHGHQFLMACCYFEFLNQPIFSCNEGFSIFPI